MIQVYYTFFLYYTNLNNINNQIIYVDNDSSNIILNTLTLLKYRCNNTLNLKESTESSFIEPISIRPRGEVTARAWLV